MHEKTVFVTVGTTQFEKLVEKVSSEEILEILYSLGYRKVKFQVGTGNFPVEDEKYNSKLELSYSRYFENFQKEILDADLVISHAGSGTCLEVLKEKKPIIVAINEDLMDNHQIELARQLQTDGYLKYCVPSQLKEVLLEKEFEKCIKYPEPDKKLFSTYLDICMGFEMKPNH